jgi:tyrosyl-tRNA synthetase
MYRYYELLTDVPLSRIEAWKIEAEAGRVNPRDLKAGLARMIASDFWGEKRAGEAADEFDRIHRHKESPADLKAHVVKSVKVSDSTKVERKRPLIDIMMEIKIFPSRGEAKRVLQQGGVYLDGRRIEDITYQLDITEKKEHILKIGKRRFCKLIVE